MQERGVLLLIHHSYGHTHKYKLLNAANLKPPLVFLLLQTWSDGQGRGCATVAPSSRHVAASHSRAMQNLEAIQASAGMLSLSKRHLLVSQEE